MQRDFKGKHMDGKHFYKQLCIFVVPIAVQNFMSALVGASDALMLGWLNQDSLSAVSLATQVQFVLNLFLMAITIGLTILAAQYWGKNDKKAVEHVLAIALRASVGVASVFALAAFAFPHQLMGIFTNEETLIELGSGYLKIVAASYIFTGISQVYLCVMKNSGRVMRSTIYSSVAIVLNLIFNAVLIFGFLGFKRLGICGAAVATLLARTVELLVVLPIANIVKNLIACVALGIATGSGIMVGNELGKGNMERAKSYGDRLCRASVGVGVISGILILLTSPLVLRFSGTLSGQAKSYLQMMLYVCSYYIVGKAVNSTVIAGIFCAGGDTKFGLFCDLITMWVIVVPLGAVAAFVFKWPVMAVYLILNLDEMVKLPAVYLHYKKYRWVKNLTKR